MPFFVRAGQNTAIENCCNSNLQRNKYRQVCLACLSEIKTRVMESQTNRAIGTVEILLCPNKFQAIMPLENTHESLKLNTRGASLRLLSKQQ